MGRSTETEKVLSIKFLVEVNTGRPRSVDTTRSSSYPSDRVYGVPRGPVFSAGRREREEKPDWESLIRSQNDRHPDTSWTGSPDLRSVVVSTTKRVRHLRIHQWKWVEGVDETTFRASTRFRRFACQRPHESVKNDCHRHP